MPDEFDVSGRAALLDEPFSTSSLFLSLSSSSCLTADHLGGNGKNVNPPLMHSVPQTFCCWIFRSPENGHKRAFYSRQQFFTPRVVSRMRPFGGESRLGQIWQCRSGASGREPTWQVAMDAGQFERCRGHPGVEWVSWRWGKWSRGAKRRGKLRGEREASQNRLSGLSNSFRIISNAPFSLAQFQNLKRFEAGVDVQRAFIDLLKAGVVHGKVNTEMEVWDALVGGV